MSKISDLRPRSKHLMFDLAEEAGIDMTDWINSSRDPRGYKANPKYCYEWAYTKPGEFILLNLWYPGMVETDGTIVYRTNFREDADFHRRVSHKTQWLMRAQRLDDAIQMAVKGGLPVRVAIVDGEMRARNETIEPSKVQFRELDPLHWYVSAYDWTTGAVELTRAGPVGRYVDQFDIEPPESAERRDVIGSVFFRDPTVRRRVLRRARGHCELCGQLGFRATGGALYLETHHVVPLSEGGVDADGNVVALCANDHRRAHFSADREAIKDRLLAKLGGGPAPNTGVLEKSGG